MNLNTHREAMLTYLRLALLSAQKSQRPGRDRFLVLSAIESAFGDYFEISQRCRQIILETTPKHILGHYPDLESALLDEEFDSFLKQIRKFCPLEKAEHLLNGKSLLSNDQNESTLSQANSILSLIQNCEND